MWQETFKKGHQKKRFVLTLAGFELGSLEWKSNALTTTLHYPYVNEMNNSWYLNLHGFHLTLHGTHYTTPYSEITAFGLVESSIFLSMVLKNSQV